MRDPETARLLSPTHPIGCKRMCVDTGYYETFNRPNVRLVDVSQHPIDEITPAGLRTDGHEFEFDALVLATGFDAMTGTLMRTRPARSRWPDHPAKMARRPAQLPRPDDRRISEPLQHHRARQSRGVHQRRSFPSSTTSTGSPIASAISTRTVARRSRRPKQAEAAWIAHVNAVAQSTLFLTCNSWYLGANIPGKPRIFMPLFGFPPYVAKCEEVARNGYEGFALA